MTGIIERLDPGMVRDLARMREIGRVPRKLTIVVDLPEVPMGNEAGANVTSHINFDRASQDPGLLGDCVRALTRNPDHG